MSRSPVGWLRPVVPFDRPPYQGRKKDQIAQEFIARQRGRPGVMPSLHLDYFGNRIKEYFKQGRGLRTETTINHPAAFKLRKGLQSLPQWRQIGFQANRRLLDVQKISQDCALGEAAFAKVNQPIQVEDRRVSALRYGDGRVQALLSAVLRFVFVTNGLSAGDLRPNLAALLGLRADQLSAGRLTYDLRRLRLHGLIERIPRTHRYRLTERGIQIAGLWDPHLQPPTAPRPGPVGPSGLRVPTTSSQVPRTGERHRPSRCPGQNRRLKNLTHLARIMKSK